MIFYIMIFKFLKNSCLPLCKNIKQGAIECLFPTNCLNCQADGEILCEDCFSTIEIIDQSYCHICKKRKPFKVFRCLSGCRSPLFHLFFATAYKKDTLIEKIIHRFKYPPFIKNLDAVLAKIISVHFELIKLEQDFFKDFIIIPIPLHIKKIKKRGFNQSTEIAKKIFPTSVFLALDVLKRVRNTIPQIEIKDKQGKKNNVKDVFQCVDSTFVQNKTILLIDDVYTTGATMEECAKVLKNAGAKRIFGCVIAAKE